MWLRRTGTQLDSAATRLTFESDYDAVLTVKARRDRLDEAITTMAADCEFTPVLRRLGCLRGIGTLTGLALAVEIGDWDRFTGKTIGSFIGLVPSEYFSGQSRVQGSITKTGNTHLRRACWSKPRGTTGPPTASDRPCGTGGNSLGPLPAPAATQATVACTTAGTPCAHDTRGTQSPTSPSPASCPAGAGPWPCSRNSPPRSTSSTTPWQQREERPATQL